MSLSYAGGTYLHTLTLCTNAVGMHAGVPELNRHEDSLQSLPLKMIVGTRITLSPVCSLSCALLIDKNIHTEIPYDITGKLMTVLILSAERS